MKNNLSKIFKRSLTAIAVTTTIALPNISVAYAEEAVQEVERIAVTGSRIKRVTMEGANPIQVITRQDLEVSGISNMGDMLQEIPSVAGAGTNSAINNGGAGAIRVSLRGLGSARTLVLLNGRRIVASGSGANASVDLSTIPTAIVKQVEVLKDGASAIYGSDAIGGVVNIITRSDFEGFEFNAGYDIGTEESDGETKNFDVTIGFAGDKGNAVVNAYYVQQGAQWSGDRDWSEFDNGLDLETNELVPGGSSATPWGRFRGFDEAADGCTDFTHGAASGPGQSDPTDVRNATGFDCWDGSTDLFNFAPANYHLTPSERYGIFASGSYELNDNIRAFTELSFNRRISDIKLAPLPLAPLAFFGFDAPYSADNYYNITQGPKNGAGESQDIADWRRRMIETGGRDTSYRNETVRLMFGLDGEFSNGWTWEASYVFGSNESASSAQGGVNFEKVALAVGPSFLDDNGNVVCGTEADPIAGCTSLNVFGVPGTANEVSQEMLDYITFEAHDFGSNEQQILSASVAGDAFELPAGTVGFAFGVEHREEKGADFPDALIALGITSGSSRQATIGSYEVDEAYVEFNLPLLSEVTAAKVLEVDVALRYSDYDTFGDTTNHKIGVRWVPFDGLMLRGTSSTAFRAPSTSDLFQGNSDNSPEVTDKCATNPTSFCIADGVPAAGFTPIGDQLSSTLGGNIDLQPEEADIFTVGAVYSPEAIEGLSLTIDYWDIEVTNAISSLGEQLILDSCAATGEHCELITRHGAGPLFGNSSDIDNRTTNVGGVDSSGVDFNIRYATELEGGNLTFNLDTTRYGTYDITQANGDVVENAGYFKRNSGDGNFPEWKTNLDVRYSTDDWSASWAVRYIGSVDEVIDSLVDESELGDYYAGYGRQFVAKDGTYNITREIDSQIIHDARFSYFLENATVTVGLDNIFDEDPPYADTGFNDNTDPRTYNTTGRHVYVNVGVSF